MKKTIYLITMLVLLASCGANGTGELVEKRAERDSLKTAYDKVGKELKKVEDWLSLNDSMATRNLPLVSAQTLQEQSFTHYIDVHGVVKADQSAALYGMGGSRVATIRVKAGDRVREGDLMMTMDNDVVDKQIAQAKASSELASTTYEKQQRLWDQQIGSEMQLLQAKTQKAQAEAGLAALKEQQRLTHITAPFNGVVDEVMARVGDMVVPTMPVARVVNLSGVQLQADVSEVYLKRVKAGAPVMVNFPSLSESFEASLQHVSEYIDPSNRTFLVTVRAPASEGYMRPNLLGDLQIQDSHIDSALVLPSPAILEDVSGKSYLFMLGTAPQGGNVKANEAVAHKVFVKRVSEYRGKTHVEPVDAGALKNGDRVVIEGAKNVSDGQTVLVDDNGGAEK